MDMSSFEELAKLRQENQQLRQANEHLHRGFYPHAWVRQLPDGWHAFVISVDPTTGHHLTDHPVESWAEAMAWVEGFRRVVS